MAEDIQFFKVGVKDAGQLPSKETAPADSDRYIILDMSGPSPVAKLIRVDKSLSNTLKVALSTPTAPGAVNPLPTQSNMIVSGDYLYIANGSKWGRVRLHQEDWAKGDNVYTDLDRSRVEELSSYGTVDGFIEYLEANDGQFKGNTGDQGPRGFPGLENAYAPFYTLDVTETSVANIYIVPEGYRFLVNGMEVITKNVDVTNDPAELEISLGTEAEPELLIPTFTISTNIVGSRHIVSATPPAIPPDTAIMLTVHTPSNSTGHIVDVLLYGILLDV